MNPNTTGPSATRPGARWTRSGRLRAFALIPTCMVGLGVIHATADAQTAPAVRYRDPVFTRVDTTRDIVYGQATDIPTGRRVDLKLDLYAPTGDTEAARPMLIFIHGGGFTAGDKASGRPYGEAFARRGYVAVSIGYRLNQGDLAGVGIPAAVADARQAIRWVLAHVDEYRLDRTRVTIGGGSAGAISALFATYTELARTADDPPAPIAAVMDLWGGLYGQESAMTTGEPPLIIVHGTQDNVVPYANALALRDRAEAVDIAYDFHPLEGVGHGSGDSAGISAWTAEFFYHELWEKREQDATPTATATVAPSAPPPTLTIEPTPTIPTVPATATARPTAGSASVVAPGATPTRLATGFTFTEGPAADRAGNVYFSDVRTSRIHRWSLAGALTTHRENTNGANGLYFRADGRLVVCESAPERRISLDDLAGGVTVLADSYAGKRLNSPNDLWVHPDGGIYFSDPRYGDQTGIEQDGMHVYYLPPGGGPLLRVTSDLVQPNGVIGTPDGRTLYIADPGQGAQKIWRYAIRPDGTLADKAAFASRGADGMAIDERGNVYLANAGRIWVHDPSGREIESIQFPEQPANMAFGGADRRTLFVTARTSLFALAMAVRGADTVWDGVTPPEATPSASATAGGTAPTPTAGPSSTPLTTPASPVPPSVTPTVGATATADGSGGKGTVYLPIGWNGSALP